ncbi:hypothetical protein BpJC7_17740 [Weizmannia acidilactici]|uniref:Transglycosylase SLT domain-containing protein n=1 Tax=Weizmannia acidilactici TaxID=2607726 RepID=A0A5J4JFQ0_9BACI|nr:lytic transglycosylase domain-containing protein [Weizmannia acidilactici]GER67372.1 hypothetical protein BpJC4_18430 [Weizmannia acidilactici]GER70471.1 hypothetical protein BpJC7_17740 [Weizmannia acidilactici]GER72628.1 hypothetical protein BpPP18_06950 [Weizmannia acidilactici]
MTTISQLASFMEMQALQSLSLGNTSSIGTGSTSSLFQEMLSLLIEETLENESGSSQGDSSSGNASSGTDSSAAALYALMGLNALSSPLLPYSAGDMGSGSDSSATALYALAGSPLLSNLAGYTTAADSSDQSGISSKDASNTNTDATDGGSIPKDLSSIISRASEKYGVPENLIKAVIQQESDFKTDAVSSAGAAGLMQLMPGTAASLGVTDVMDPGQNVDAGTKYLKTLLDKYNDNVQLALAAYNAGPANVDRYGGIPPFKETQNYVASIMDNLT